MDEIEIQTALNEFENRMLEGDESAARMALRLLLSRYASIPIEGSVADLAAILADLPRPPAGAASVILRSIARVGFLQDNAANQLARSVVSLGERGLPGLSNLLGLKHKSQTFEKFELLRGAKAWVDEQLAPLRVPYTTLESMLLARKAIIRGNLADTVFGNIRALTTTSNVCLLLVGGENMPFVMDRQGQKLNKFSRVNLTYFDRANEWDDYVQLIREPSRNFLHWHNDAIAEIYDLTNGNPYFSKIICSKVFARALRERDVDVTREEVRDAVNAEVSRFDENLFAHLWQDGIFAPVDEREPIVLKRRRVLAAVARCARTNLPATLANLFAQRSTSELTEADLRSVLADFISREVLVEEDGGYRTVLPIFQLWLVDIGLTRLAADALSQDLAADTQRAEDEARVLSDELVTLTRRWPTYRGRHVGPEEVRAWLNQLPSIRDQRSLFTILKATRFFSEEDVLERIRSARLVVLGLTDVAVRRKTSERRNDIVITYVDGEGKSGQRYASLYAEENLVATAAILPPSTFSEAYRRHVAQHSVPKVIVIVDDLVGTGRSLAANMKRFHDANLALLTADRPVVLAFALLTTLEGQQFMLQELSKLEYDRIDFRAGEVLDGMASLFAGVKGAFASVEERDCAKAVATDIGATIYRNAPLGFGGQSLSVVFPTTVPNNSLPLLHSRGKGPVAQWRPLFERLVN